jgi:hypothetical protein
LTPKKKLLRLFKQQFIHAMKLKLFICLSLFTTFTNAQWRVTTPAGTTINDITFTDRFNGYAVFQSAGIGSCTVSHGLYKTTLRQLKN